MPPGRPEIPLDPRAPFADFASGLRALRAASSKTYQQISEEVFYRVSTLSGAAGGRRLPSLEVTLAYVRACGGEAGEWTQRWEDARRRRRRSQKVAS